MALIEFLLIVLCNHEFDYVIFPKRFKYTPQDFTAPFLKANHFLQEYFKPKIWGGYNDTPSKDLMALQENPYSGFKINIPKDKITYNLPDDVRCSHIFSDAKRRF